ncbi:hypothetical protein, partial [uncultured Sphingomonas sp.]|uniref:hypothetical protein n=1 Tax=uncultured Sphingomonas sp. TaxID=158754 RepID=UPI0025E820FA
KMRDAKVWRNVISLWVQIPLAFDFAQAERISGSRYLTPFSLSEVEGQGNLHPKRNNIAPHLCVAHLFG